MGRGGFPPSETGSFSAHHTAQRVGFFFLCFQHPCVQSRERAENRSVFCRATRQRTLSGFPARLFSEQNTASGASKLTCSQDFFTLGSFYLPTYGVLVASGVLIGLWISVRNSEKQGINGDDAWNLGILVVLAGIVGAKLLYIINDWSSYAGNWREIFSLNTLQAGGVFSGGLVTAWSLQSGTCGAITCPSANRRWFCPGTGIRAHARPLRLFLRRMLLRKAHKPCLGSDLHESFGECCQRHAARSAHRADATDRSRRRIFQFPGPDMAAGTKEI